MLRRSHVALAIVFAACGSARLTGPVAVRDVAISVDVPGQCLFSCDPPGQDRTTPTLVRAVNRGRDTSYISLCGDQPAWTEQQFVGGRWQNTYATVDCVVGPVSRPLAPDDSVRINWFPESGVRSRMTLTVGGTASLGDGELAASAAVEINATSGR
ncbi:MAG TPA: hypothetical protein VNE60_03220 [Gemmatimonadaceae bacterium]|nr:hypothetical protein [Gemmatimonadaceae bacterium]